MFRKKYGYRDTMDIELSRILALEYLKLLFEITFIRFFFITSLLKTSVGAKTVIIANETGVSPRYCVIKIVASLNLVINKKLRGNQNDCPLRWTQ